jgi:hypothetical protein
MTNAFINPKREKSDAKTTGNLIFEPDNPVIKSDVEITKATNA